MTCANCEALRAQVKTLERQMGESFPKGALGAVAQRFKLSLQQARLLLTIYYRDDWTKPEFIEKHLGMDYRVIMTTVYRLRRSMGREAIESHWGIGYRLADDSRRQIEGVLG